MEETKSVFSTLNALNVNEHTEKKNNLTYLSWAWAVAEVLKAFPDTTWEVKLFDGKPYIYDENTGYMVFTKVTINGVTREMWLPVMDGANRALKNHSYEVKTKYGTNTVAAATMFDINKTIMRCLTKNLSVFGLGLYIYAGEDLPEDESAESSTLNTQEDFDKLKEKLIDFMATDILSSEEQDKTQKYIDNKNLKMMNAILATCVARTKKQGA